MSMHQLPGSDAKGGLVIMKKKKDKEDNEDTDVHQLPGSDRKQSGGLMIMKKNTDADGFKVLQEVQLYLFLD